MQQPPVLLKPDVLGRLNGNYTITAAEHTYLPTTLTETDQQRLQVITATLRCCPTSLDSKKILTHTLHFYKPCALNSIAKQNNPIIYEV